MTAPRTPRVLVDLSLAPVGGAGTYVAGFVAGLLGGDVADQSEVVLLLAESWVRENGWAPTALSEAGVPFEVIEVPEAGTWKARLLRGTMLRAAVKRVRADVVFLPRETAPRLRGPFVLLANNLKAWQSFEDGSAVSRRAILALRRWVAARSVRRATLVLAVSEVMAAVLPSGIAVGGVVHHGCDLPEQAPSPFPRAKPGANVVMICNIGTHKGIEAAIDAVAHLRAVGGEWTLEVHGSASDSDYFDQLDRQGRRQLDASVFMGPVGRDHIGEVYRRSDIVVVGSSFESFCHPLVEGMRSGCTVVAPDCALVDEICGDVAVTYTESDMQSLAGALTKACTGPLSRTHAGIERSRGYTWASTVGETVRLVRSAAQR